MKAPMHGWTEMCLGAFMFLGLIGLGGCATPYDPTPDIHDVTDAARVRQDVSDCAAYAQAYRRPLSVVGVATATGQGSIGTLATGVASVPGMAIGGGAGLLNALVQWFGLINTDGPKAAQQCVRQRLDRDHSGILVEAPL